MDKIAVCTDNIFRKLERKYRKAKQYIKKATEEEAVMIIFFQEYFMNYYPDAEHNYTKRHKACMEFVQTMKMLAKEFKIWIILG